MRRRTVSQRVEKETKTRARHFLSHPQCFEHKLLHITPVNSDRAAGDFDSVDYCVVRLRPNLTEQFRLSTNCAFEQRHVLVERRGKRMMHRIIPSVVLVKFEHWEIGYPQRREHIFGKQVFAASNLVAQRSEGRGDYVRLSGND